MIFIIIGREDSRRCLVDSCASTMHAHLVLESCRVYTLAVEFSEAGSMSFFYDLVPVLLRFFYQRIRLPDHYLNASQPSSIFEFRFLDCPLLLFSLLSGFSNFGPSFNPHILRFGSCLNFRQSLPGLHVPFWRFFFQTQLNSLSQ